VVLCRKNVARTPPDARAEFDEGFDQDGGLNGHVDATGDSRAGEWLFFAEFFADCHQSGHFGFGDLDFFSSEFGECGVFDFEIVHFLGLKIDRVELARCNLVRQQD